MKRSLLLWAALVAHIPDAVLAQDKALEAVCGELFGARQTAIRMRDSGFPLQTAINETLARSEWRNASTQHQQLAVRVVQEAYFAPELKTSNVVSEVCRSAIDAPKRQ
ncbi:MAG TPA: hypothetical protein VLD36_01900 [Burkholderiales bacterium]|nr:hypothetical protein [Burkholderiales bacterium]